MAFISLVQYALFSIAGLLTAHYVRAGVREYLGNVLMHAFGAMAVLVAMSLGWTQPLSVVLQAVVVLLPYVLTFAFQRLIEQATHGGDYQRALQLAIERAKLFPFEHYRTQVPLFRGLAKAQQRAEGSGRRLDDVLKEVALEPGFEVLYHYTVVAELTRRAAKREWSSMERMFDEDHPFPKDDHKLVATTLLIRAACEQGHLDEALARVEGLEARPHWRRLRSQLHVAWLSILATGGRREAVEELLAHQLSHFPHAVALAWKARAAWAAGAVEEARNLIQPLLELSALASSYRRVIEERLAQMASPPPPRTPRTERALDRIEHLVRADYVFFHHLRRSFSTYPTVGYLMVAMLAFFSATWILLEPKDSLARFGALGALEFQEPWRYLTSIFMHDGWLHLLLSVMALISVGVVVEGVYGSFIALLLFFGAGLTSQGIAAWRLHETLLIGSQGAVAGWMGALIYLFIKNRRDIPLSWSKAILGTMLYLLVLMLLMDILSPRITAWSIVSGLLVGLLVSPLLPPRGLKPRTKASVSGSTQQAGAASGPKGST